MHLNTFEIHTIQIAVMYNIAIIAVLTYFELVLNMEILRHLIIIIVKS